MASGAHAEVTLTFYSHHFGTYGFSVTFPHAYVTLSGTTESDAKPVKANFGFTAQTISPSIAWQSVEGFVISMPDDYVAMSQPHLSLPISDKEYRAVLAIVDRWRKYPQPSYNLDTRNCVTFVREMLSRFDCRQATTRNSSAARGSFWKILSCGLSKPIEWSRQAELKDRFHA